MVTATMLTLSPLFVRPFSQQPNDNSPSIQPFALFVLPDTPTVSEPVVPVLVTVLLPAELSDHYQLSDFFVLSDGIFVPTSPLLEEPFFDSQTNSFVWLFSGFFEVSQIPQSPIPSPLTLSAHAFFEPFDPSLSPISAFDQISLTLSLPQFEESQEETKEETKASDEPEEKPSEGKQTVSSEKGEKGEAGKVSSGDGNAVSQSSTREPVLKDPEMARKAFEQEVASKALSNAKKNPKSTAKGNGLVITVGAYPEVLPADGKSTSFIVVKVTDEEGKPISGKEVRFSADGGKLLVPKANTNKQGIAFSRLCSEVLKKGQKKLVRVKAMVNPEAETEVLFDGSLSSYSISTASASTSSTSASVSVYWWSNPSNTQSLVCSSNGGSASGFSGIAAHVVVPSSPMHFVYPNFLKVIGDGHPFQKQMGNLSSDSYTPCAPYVGEGYVKYSWNVYPEMTGWQRYHRSNIALVFNYTIARPFPPPGQFWTEEKVVTVQAVNAVLKLSPRNPPVFVWDPENPPTVEKRTVTFRVETLQNSQVAVTVSIYRGLRYTKENAIKTISVTVPTNQDVSITWDGSVDSGEGMPPWIGSMLAEKGVYAYDVLALVQQVVPNRFDADRRCSPSMKIERAKDEEGREIFDAEYYGYDDNGTEEEGDDGHLYFIRWYVLKCGSAYFDNDGDSETSLFVDNDGDKRFDEDWVDGIDNDGDGRIDEDPAGGWDEDWLDGQDNDGDGQVDEDGPDPVDASKGEVILYDPDLEAVANWDLKSLLCLEHNANDGLVASLEGVRHGVLVRVPVSLMQKAGIYHFVLRIWDNHAHLHKDHQFKPALEMNQVVSQLPPIVYIHYENWHIAWCLPGRGVQFRTMRANPATYCVVRSFTNNTPQSHVRAAINGGFFYAVRNNTAERQPHYYHPNPDAPWEHNTPTCGHQRMIAEVGTGTEGRWQYGTSVPASDEDGEPDRWCFGMTRDGTRIMISQMERKRERIGRRIVTVYRVNSNIERSYPYGLSNVGLLVLQGQAQPRPRMWGGYRTDMPARRTAMAWTTHGHIFFITTIGGVTWQQTANFIIQTLPIILRNPPYNTHIDQSTINAVMLDGCGSTKFGYRLNPINSSTYPRFPRNHRDTAPYSPRYLTTYIIAEAQFQER